MVVKNPSKMEVRIQMKRSMVRMLDEYGEESGLSRNALISVAVDAYLKAQAMQRQAVDKLVESLSSGIQERLSLEAMSQTSKEDATIHPKRKRIEPGMHDEMVQAILEENQ